jgi:hypothetical protein
MAKPLTPQQFNTLYRSFTLEKYLPPTEVDKRAVLAASTEKTRFGQPTAQGWVVSDKGIMHDKFTIKTEHPVFASRLEALIYHRNATALQLAKKLAALDKEISFLANDLFKPTDDVPSDIEQPSQDQSND